MKDRDSTMHQEERAGTGGAPMSESPSRGTVSRPPSSGRRRVSLSKNPIVLVIVVVLGLGAGMIALLLSGRTSSQEGRPVPAPTGVPVPSASGGATEPRPGDVTLTLSPDELQNARISTEPVTEQRGAVATEATGSRTTGTVQSNAYKEVSVTPVAGGIVREVNVQLGDKAGRGQDLATIFSTELADAQAGYLRMIAENEQHHEHHRRTAELVEIGAASREELERAAAEDKTVEANLSSGRQRLILLGMNPKQIDALRSPDQIKSLLTVRAPSSGTVISRTVNPGEVVAAGKELFRLADLSTVWVIGQVYENDLRTVGVGMPAIISTPAYTGRTFRGRISYIDARVDPQTRTVQVRIEVANPGEVLRLGMFVDVSFGGAAPSGTTPQHTVIVASAAVQTIGEKRVVFIATGRPGVFVQREVTTGAETNGQVPVYSGLAAGERVVTEGSFLLRAESLKQNPEQTAPHHIH